MRRGGEGGGKIVYRGIICIRRRLRFLQFGCLRRTGLYRAFFRGDGRLGRGLNVLIALHAHAGMPESVMVLV